MPSHRWLVLLLVAWVAWPLAVAALNLWLAPGGQCTVEVDCAHATPWWRAALWIALAVLPGTLVLAWRRHERQRTARRT